jgi:hypothetical protein
MAAVWSVTQAAAPQTALVDYQQQVHPILAAKCLSCHSAQRRAGGLSLASYADALLGGRSGAAIEPGNAAGSISDPARQRRPRGAHAAQSRTAVRR